MLAEPRRYIAQHRVELSTCPTWDRPASVRWPRGGWTCGPSSSPGRIAAILGAARRADPGGAARGLVRGELQPGRRLEGHLGAAGGGSVISRVADHCFWFGRYVDRAESTARLLQVTRTLVFDADIPVTQCWQPLVIVSGEHPAFVERYGAEAAGQRRGGAGLHDLVDREPGQPAQHASAAPGRAPGSSATCSRWRPGRRSTSSTCGWARSAAAPVPGGPRGVLPAGARGGRS